MARITLTLYVMGLSTGSDRLEGDLRQLCDRACPGEYQLTVINLRQHPELAEREKVLTTPTLVRESPLPRRRISGDLSNEQAVLEGLELANSRRTPHMERGS